MSGHNFIESATLAILEEKVKAKNQVLDLDYVGVKVPQFSFSRLKNVDPALRVEMASTGEVACLGDDVEEAYLKAVIAAEQNLPEKTVLISLGGEENKVRFFGEAQLLSQLGLKIYATEKTCAFLNAKGIKATKLYKIFEKKEPNIATFLAKKKLDLVINITDPDYKNNKFVNDDYEIRRSTVDFGIPLLTNLQAAKLFVHSLSQKKKKDLKVKAYRSYLN